MNDLDMGSYTQDMYQNMLNEAAEGYDIEGDYSVLLDKINSDDFFEPFSGRLLRYLSQYKGEELSPDEAYLFLYNRMKAAGSNPNRNTLKNWLNVSGAPEGSDGPKWGDAGREAMFQIAFALSLNIIKTEDFFRRVFLDKAFNYRNVREFVYFYCIFHGKPYSEAKDLASKAEQLLSSGYDSASTADTVLLWGKGQTVGDDAELLSFVADHYLSFTRKNETALREQERLLRELQGSDLHEGLAEKEYLCYINLFDGKGSEGRNLHSVDFVLDMAVNGAGEIKKTSRVPEIKRAREVFSRKEISTQFPGANTISHPDSSFILRKNIIFLFFYWFWVQYSLKIHSSWNEETFQEEMNNTLYKCGFSPLYYGNPYDWLFLYCSHFVLNDFSPLDVFRAILSGNEDF
ncbi:MAG: hypothetical protein K6C12_06150 [Oscillospiraceae bacterium]|nr:hypothetical protein [Oscillospiraceae bacterium]